MSYINVVMSLMDFIPYTSEIIEKNAGFLYLEKKDKNNFIVSVKVDTANFEDVIETNREKNLKFFVSSRELKSGSNFYDDNICRCLIEGVGGRETKESIERIALRLISKTPEKEILKIFNAIKNKLKKDESIGMGVKGDSSMHKSYFYQKDYVGSKIFKTDFNNDKAPLVIVK